VRRFALELPDVDGLDPEAEVVEAAAEPAIARVAVVDRGGERPRGALAACTALRTLAPPAGAVVGTGGTRPSSGTPARRNRPSLKRRSGCRADAVGPMMRPLMPRGAS
jgi:hypothetical protein